MQKVNPCKLLSSFSIINFQMIFLGITSKLDYLVGLGTDAVWISPIYESPMKDFGYDISNFTNIDPTFGTLEDFSKMAQAFREKGKNFEFQSM